MMPLYEFECPNKHVTEKMICMDRRREPIDCEHRDHAGRECGRKAELKISAQKGNFPGADQWR